MRLRLDKKLFIIHFGMRYFRNGAR